MGAADQPAPNTEEKKTKETKSFDTMSRHEIKQMVWEQFLTDTTIDPKVKQLMWEQIFTSKPLNIKDFAPLSADDPRASGVKLDPKNPIYTESDLMVEKIRETMRDLLKPKKEEIQKAAPAGPGKQMGQNQPDSKFPVFAVAETPATPNIPARIGRSLLAI